LILLVVYPTTRTLGHAESAASSGRNSRDTFEPIFRVIETTRSEGWKPIQRRYNQLCVPLFEHDRSQYNKTEWQAVQLFSRLKTRHLLASFHQIFAVAPGITGCARAVTIRKASALV